VSVIANAYLDGQGHLVIKALKAAGRRNGYTSARLTTQGLFAPNHGNIEARINLAIGGDGGGPVPESSTSRP
jgi:beta-glucanase (GH16 family)